MNLYVGHSLDTKEEIRLPLSEVGNILIAGCTGTGKSIYLHMMLKRLFAEYDPESLKLLVFDVKRVEFHRLKRDPHLLRPIALDYQDFEEQIAFLEGMMGRRKESDPPILFIIDEFSDAYYHDKSIVKPIEQLMEAGPENGIHLILATQVPSSYSEKMLNLSTKMSFGQFAKDSRMFIGSKESEGLEQGEAIIVMKDGLQRKVRVVYEK